MQCPVESQPPLSVQTAEMPVIILRVAATAICIRNQGFRGAGAGGIAQVSHATLSYDRLSDFAIGSR